ncbi:MAG: hypothetical protein ACR2O6_15355 [Ilumatobacteraceae bacterium]
MIATSTADLAVFVVVVGARLLVPLLILRYPLPAILAALVIDAADQTIFDQLTDLDLTSYQGYDKALDIYYLAIAYISTFRNWRHPAALTVATFLWYYRLVGVTLFELTEVRALLLIFPNTFEYFFIFFEVVRTKWSTSRVSARFVVYSAAAIWVFIKLPQEWWIHIAQLDFTDFMKEDVFGVDAADSWGTAFTNRPAVTALILAILVALTVVAVIVWRRLPPADHRFTVDADKVWPPEDERSVTPERWTDGLVEKAALLSLVLVIFSEGIPALTASIPVILAAIAVIVIANAFVSQALRRRPMFEGAWASAGGAFVVTVVVNSVIWAAVSLLLPTDDRGASTLATAFYLLLVSLIITLFDRFHARRYPAGLRRDPAAIA